MDALSLSLDDFSGSSATKVHQCTVYNRNLSLNFRVDNKSYVLSSDKIKMSPRNNSSEDFDRKQGLWSSFESCFNSILNPVLQPSSSVFAQPYTVLSGKDKNNNSDSLINSEGKSSCKACGVNSTPEWRKGPGGKKSLCNACGLRYSRSTRRIRQKHEERKKVRVLLKDSNALTAFFSNQLKYGKGIEKRSEREGVKEENDLKQVCAIEKKPQDQAKEDQRKIVEILNLFNANRDLFYHDDKRLQRLLISI